MRRLALVIAVLASITSMPAFATPHHGRSPYPGGRWRPPPPTFGMIADKNVPVTMDDGARLVADVYYPADPQTKARAPGRFPVLLTQSPYSLSLNATSGGVALPQQG